LGLKWTDVDLEAGVLSVQRSLDTYRAFNPSKRNKSRRTVKLTDPTIEALKGHRTHQNEERLRLGSLREDHNLVFPNRIGKPMNADNLYHREFKPLLKKVGLFGFTFHSLRHTCATLLCSKRQPENRPKNDGARKYFADDGHLFSRDAQNGGGCGYSARRGA
jgi:integrase